MATDKKSYIDQFLSVDFICCQLLSPGQTDRQVVGSGRKLNLGRDLRWVAKRTRKFPRKYTQVAKKKHFKADYPLFHWLKIG